MTDTLQVLIDNGCSDFTVDELLASTARVEIRQQGAKGSWPRQGPDTYVAVQIIPEGVTPLTVLNRSNATKRGIRIVYCGEGYRNRQKTDRSMLGSAIQTAKILANVINLIEELH